MICLAIVKDNAMPACDKCWRSGKLGLKMREVRSGARGEGGGRRKEDKMGSQWVGGCVGAWMGKREREKETERERERERESSVHENTHHATTTHATKRCGTTHATTTHATHVDDDSLFLSDVIRYGVANQTRRSRHMGDHSTCFSIIIPEKP